MFNIIANYGEPYGEVTLKTCGTRMEAEAKLAAYEEMDNDYRRALRRTTGEVPVNANIPEGYYIQETKGKEICYRNLKKVHTRL